MTFSEQLKADIALIEPALEKYLSRETGEGYDRIFEAAKYSAMAGGKLPASGNRAGILPPVRRRYREGAAVRVCA